MELGTRNALFHYHAGHDPPRPSATSPAARTELSTALEINPAFHPLWAPQAAEALDDLVRRRLRDGRP